MTHKELDEDIRSISCRVRQKLDREKKKNPKRYKSKEKKLSHIRTELRNLRDSI